MVRFLCYLLVLLNSRPDPLPVLSTADPIRKRRHADHPINADMPANAPSKPDDQAPITREEMQELFAKSLSQR